MVSAAYAEMHLLIAWATKSEINTGRYLPTYEGQHLCPFAMVVTANELEEYIAIVGSEQS